MKLLRGSCVTRITRDAIAPRVARLGPEGGLPRYESLEEEVVERSFERILRAFLATAPERADPGIGEISREQREHLRALGCLE